MSIMSPSILNPMQEPKAKALNKPELMKLLIQGILGTVGQTFKQKLETVFKRMPKIGTTAQPEYISHFFRGAILTLPKANLMQQLKITKIYLEKNNRASLPGPKSTRVAFQIEDRILKLYIFAPTKKIRPDQHIYRESLQGLIKAAGLVEYEIHGEIIHINDKYEVSISSMQVYDQGSLKGMDVTVRELQSDLSSNAENEIWERIVQSDLSQSFESSFLDLSSSDTLKTQIAITTILQNMQDTYRTYKSYLLESEAAYHGFLHGALEMNFLYRYALTIRVEPVLGIGESRGDLLFLSRLEPSSGKFTDDKSWDNIAGLLEVKSKGISAEKAFNQMDQYVLNDIGLRTVRDQVFLVFWNPGLSRNEATGTQIKKIWYLLVIPSTNFAKLYKSPKHSPNYTN